MYKEELEELRSQNKKLQDRLKSSKTAAVIGSAMDVSSEKEIMSEVEGNPVMKNHILALNGVIGEIHTDSSVHYNLNMVKFFTFCLLV